MSLLPLQFEPILRAALAEDIGAGDVTTRLTVPDDARAAAVLKVKADGVVCGLELAARTFTLVDPRVAVTLSARDGDRVGVGVLVGRIEGPAASVLMAERVALNVLQRLSGIASLTRSFVDAAGDSGARIVDTRKTTPGLRALEKYAVRCGGGTNHRFGLSDGILIKDNHLAAGGGVAACVARAKAGAPHPLKVEVECKTLAQVDEAVAAGADILLLDNMDPATLARAVRQVAGRARTEASGGVRLETVAAIAASGVDLISVGALTHSAPALDIALDFEEGLR